MSEVQLSDLVDVSVLIRALLNYARMANTFEIRLRIHAFLISFSETSISSLEFILIRS